MAKFPFNDLHSFKDYVGFVKLCSPDSFPIRDGLRPDEQWTLTLAFEGLRRGLQMAAEEKGDLPAFAECRAWVDEAFQFYQAGQMRDGFFKLEEVQKRLKKVPSW